MPLRSSVLGEKLGKCDYKVQIRGRSMIGVLGDVAGNAQAHNFERTSNAR